MLQGSGKRIRRADQGTVPVGKRRDLVVPLLRCLQRRTHSVTQMHFASCTGVLPTENILQPKTQTGHTFWVPDEAGHKKASPHSPRRNPRQSAALAFPSHGRVVFLSSPNPSNPTARSGPIEPPTSRTARGDGRRPAALARAEPRGGAGLRPRWLSAALARGRPAGPRQRVTGPARRVRCGARLAGAELLHGRGDDDEALLQASPRRGAAGAAKAGRGEDLPRTEVARLQG